MSATTRTLGHNWTVKVLAGGTCTACSTDADAVVVTAGTCTTLGGMDNLDIGGTKDMIDVTAFEDTMTKNVPGRISLDTLSFSGSYDGVCSTQKTLVGDIFHEGRVATANTVRVVVATDTVNKRKHTIIGYVNNVKVTIPVKGKGNFSFSLLPTRKIQVCTYL